MQKNQITILITLLAVLGSASQAAPLGTAFTYQGWLLDGGTAANGLYDMRFSLFDADTGGALVGSPTTLSLPARVTNGLFSVTLDFSGATFAGDARWLAISVRTNGSILPHTPLSPRQPLTPAPYALWASGAGGVADNSITSGKIPTGQVVKSLNGLHDAVSLQAGANVTLTPSGNGLQIAATGVGGSGTANYLPLFTGSGTLGNSQIYQGTGGALGIGTTTPAASALHVKSSAANNWAIRVEGREINGSGGQIHFGASGLTTYIAEGEDDGIYVVAPQGVAFGPGNVGIGVSSLSQASHRLTVVSSPQNDNVLRLIGRSGTYQYGAKLNFGDGDYAFLQEDFDDWLQVYADKGTRILGGNVGIGTSDPQQKLHVNGVARFDVAGGSINLSTPGGNPGLIAFAQNGHRRDIVFQNDGMRILVGDSASPASVGIDLLENGTTRVKVLQITGGADIAEPFQMSNRDIPKGAVVVIDEDMPGRLKMSGQPYDTRVAGIVSGANGINPGISLHQEGALDGGEHVALSGRVYALADAASGAIKPGDLLTTSDTPGHAMKVIDHAKAQGAIIGKAMSGLGKGRGLVLVLVSLQ